MSETLERLEDIRRPALWTAMWTIHNANHIRPEDRVAVKPHASPIFHAIQYLMGNQSLKALVYGA